MVEIVQWPCDLLRLTSSQVFLRNTSRVAGASLAGVDQIISAGAQVWEITLGIGPDFEQDRIKEIEAKITLMDGRTNIAALCVFDAFAYDGTASPRQWPFTDGTWFSDGTGFADPGAGVEPLVVAANVAADDESLTVVLTDPVRPHLRIGDLFSVAGFLYRVVDRNVGAGTVRFRPRARQAIPAGTILQTAKPTIYARFASDDQGARARGMLSIAEPITLTFVEAFDR